MEVIRGEAVFPEGILQIGNKAFANRYDLIEAIVPEGVKEIEEAAFACSNLQRISLPETVEEIKPFAFMGCRRLTSITIPDKASVDELCFYGCDNLRSIVWKGKEIPVVCRNGIIIKEQSALYYDRYKDLIEVLLMMTRWGMKVIVPIAFFFYVIRAMGFISAEMLLSQMIGLLVMDTLFLVIYLTIRQILLKWVCVFKKKGNKK